MASSRPAGPSLAAHPAAFTIVVSRTFSSISNLDKKQTPFNRDEGMKTL
jgi:hypothetical protein